jgi:hypothetical protein
MAIADWPSVQGSGLGGPPGHALLVTVLLLASVAALISPGAEVQVHPAALPLDLVVVSSRMEARPVDQQRRVADSVLDAAGAGRADSGPGLSVRFASAPAWLLCRPSREPRGRGPA